MKIVNLYRQRDFHGAKNPLSLEVIVVQMLYEVVSVSPKWIVIA